MSAPLPTVVLRPAPVFGPDDHFTRPWLGLIARLPGILPLPAAHTKLAPLYVGDLVKAIEVSATLPSAPSQTYSLCGPNTESLETWVRYLAALKGIRLAIIPLGPCLSRVWAAFVAQGWPFWDRDRCQAPPDGLRCSSEWPLQFSPPESAYTRMPGWIHPAPRMLA